MKEKNNNIALMTWFKYKNYGTSLQVAALYNVIKKMGYNVKVINYTPKSNGKYLLTFRDLIRRLQKRWHSRLIKEINSSERNEKFETFLKNQIETTKEKNTYSELALLNNEFDAFICGSDQIWAPSCYNDKYFLSFVTNKKKIISYAPSIGLNYIENPIVKEKMKELINRFCHLSIRESQGQKIIKNLCNKDAKLVLDPTLLINNSQWDSILKEYDADKLVKNNINQKYIFCYFLGNSKKYYSYINQFSKLTGLKVYVLPTQKIQLSTTKKIGNIIPFESGPAEFVSLIKNAEYVITDSFHGMIFSIIYKTKFIIFERFNSLDAFNQNSRIYNLLNLLNLENRLADYKNLKCITEKLNCSFDTAHEKLNTLKAESTKYLMDSINLACKENHKECSHLAIYQESNFSSTTNRTLCCGCGACAVSCPTNAIKIKINNNGFYHYYLDKSKCINCGKCKKICPLQNINSTPLKNCVGFYSGQSNNMQTLLSSSSGGISYEISKYVNKANYYVVGCTYDEKNEYAKHIIIPPNNAEKLKTIQGSKYLQSDFFSAINDIIKLNKAVVFGTPCQISGLHNILKDKNIRENFILIDLICHGVPTKKLWDKYISEIKQKINIQNKLPTVIFRYKKLGWHKKYIFIKSHTKKYIKSDSKDNFYSFFEEANCFMETCYECPYRNSSSADIRLGDYWGELFKYNKTGISMITALSKKGNDFLLSLSKKNTVTLNKQNIKDYYSFQSTINQTQPYFYDDLINELKNDDISLSTIRKKYCKMYEWEKILSKPIDYIIKHLYH